LQAMKNAYAPYSNFHVGACLMGDDDKHYIGCNVENASYGLTICAERNAISTMIANGAKKIKAIVIVASCDRIITPCGGCRQVMGELADPNIKVYMFNRVGDCIIKTIAELLPNSFDTEFLREQEEQSNKSKDLEQIVAAITSEDTLTESTNITE